MNNFGCRFSLYPMIDNFIEQILGSLAKNDSSAVYANTDAISTIYRGGVESVTDAVKGLFVNAYKDGVHMRIEGGFSNSVTFPDAPRSCDTPNKDKIRDIHFPVKCMMTVYSDEKGKAAFEKTKESFTADMREIPYGTRFAGDVGEIFDCIEKVILALDNAGCIYTLRFVMNCNSPTRE